MVLSVTLRVFLLYLLSPCLRGTEVQNVDQNSLARIIAHIQNRYHPLKGRQFAVAISVPAQSCGTGFQPVEDFPPGNEPATVRAHFTNRKIYRGNMMIGAVPAKKFHSEYLLLNPPDPNQSPMMNLLNQNRANCVIFYTYFSPCTNTCLNQNKSRNILDALKMFNAHNGPKAFVFNKIYKVQDLHAHGQNIDNNVWLYRCFPNPDNYECYHCFHNNQLVPECQA